MTSNKCELSKIYHVEHTSVLASDEGGGSCAKSLSPSFTCNSNTMGCPPVRGENIRALASGLVTYRWTYMVYLFHNTYIRVYLANCEIFRAEVGKGGINTR